MCFEDGTGSRRPSLRLGDVGVSPHQNTHVTKRQVEQSACLFSNPHWQSRESAPRLPRFGLCGVFTNFASFYLLQAKTRYRAILCITHKQIIAYTRTSPPHALYVCIAAVRVLFHGWHLKTRNKANQASQRHNPALPLTNKNSVSDSDTPFDVLFICCLPLP